MKHEHHEHPHGGHDLANVAGTAVDPVCGMKVKIEGARHTHLHGTDKYYFCSARCREKFIAHPEHYLDPAAKARTAEAEAKARPKGTLYTCPMHPEIVQVGPGTCPKCGMALEPKGVPPADAGPNPELVDFTHRLWIGAALTVPILVIAMGPDLGLPLHRWLSPQAAGWVELILATPGGAVVRLAVPGARLGLDREPQPEHVDADRDRRARRLCLQPCRGACAGAVPARIPDARRRCRPLFRGRRRHRRPGSGRPGARIEGPRENRRRHPRPPRSGPEDGPSHGARRHGKRSCPR